MILADVSEALQIEFAGMIARLYRTDSSVRNDADAIDSSSCVRTLRVLGRYRAGLCDNRPIYSHSARSVTAGSMRIAARAGMRIATSATSVSSTGTAMNANGS